MGNETIGQAFPFCDNQMCLYYTLLQTGIIKEI
jgi:hypothetical protein